MCSGFSCRFFFGIGCLPLSDLVRVWHSSAALCGASFRLTTSTQASREQLSRRWIHDSPYSFTTGRRRSKQNLEGHKAGEAHHQLPTGSTDPVPLSVVNQVNRRRSARRTYIWRTAKRNPKQLWRAVLFYRLHAERGLASWKGHSLVSYPRDEALVVASL